MAERLRGRAGVAQRLRRLRAEPLCRMCKAKGIIRASEVPDHILALALGGTDDDSNIQCLCDLCHSRKTQEEFNRPRRAPIDEDGWPDLSPSQPRHRWSEIGEGGLSKRV
jgi:5-methylcytosine-specific restriction protein A